MTTAAGAEKALFSLAGKVAIVTGGSRGIGAAVADGLAGAGATVVALARSVRPRAPYVNPVRYLSGDVTAGIAPLCASIHAEFGRLDILVNVAGISLPHRIENQLGAFEETVRVNLESVYGCCRNVKEHMRAGSSIINVTSIGSVLGFPGNPGYIAAKGGLRALTKALAVDYGAYGIRVNALAPGYIHTDMTDGSYHDPVEHERRRAHTCLGRWGEVEDLVGGAIFLASDASSYVTGIDLFVDGGWTAKGLV